MYIYTFLSRSSIEQGLSISPFHYGLPDLRAWAFRGSRLIAEQGKSIHESLCLALPHIQYS